MMVKAAMQFQGSAAMMSHDVMVALYKALAELGFMDGVHMHACTSKPLGKEPASRFFVIHESSVMQCTIREQLLRFSFRM